MKKLILISSIIIFIISCKDTTKTTPSQQSKSTTQLQKLQQVETPPKINIENHLKNYNNLKQTIRNKKTQLKNRNNINEQQKVELAQQYISNYLIDSIFHYWEGTKWDFNGHTKEPKNGKIACGYFITTTLKDIGIQLERIRLAQQASAVMINQLCKTSSIKKFTTMDKLNQYMEHVGENEILLVGLEFHVGFIFKRNNKNYFAHSNYIGSEGVMVEIANQSSALKSSNFYMIGNLTKNENFIQNWLR